MLSFTYYNLTEKNRGEKTAVIGITSFGLYLVLRCWKICPGAQNITEGLRVPSENESFKNNFLLDQGGAIRQK